MWSVNRFILIRHFVCCMGILFLAACASSPYKEGKSPANVPAHVDVIHLRNVYLTDTAFFEADKEANGDPKRDPSPSKNDQEATAIFKANIASQLTNLGYSIVEGPYARADIDMSFFITYLPERWPLTSRTASVTGRVYDASGTPIFKMVATHSNETGNWVANLVTAVAGSSRDEMVSAATREAVVKVVQEMRKGTKENRPVRAVSATPQFIQPQTGMVSR